jgi:hypothetical protein
MQKCMQAMSAETLNMEKINQNSEDDAFIILFTRISYNSRPTCENYLGDTVGLMVESPMQRFKSCKTGFKVLKTVVMKSFFF